MTTHKTRKDWRRPYRGSKAFDATCRNHGTCKWCEGNRLHATRKRKLSARESE